MQYMLFWVLFWRTKWCFHFQKTREEWQIVFYICAGFYAVGAIFYSIFGTGVEQPWAQDPEDREDSLKADGNAVEDGLVTVPLNTVDGGAEKTANGEPDTTKV
jgi:hypothetical protein